MPTVSKIGGERTVLYTQKEAADLVGVSERTMRSYIKQGRIPAVTIRRRVFVWDRHLMQYIRGAKTTRIYGKVESPQFDTLGFDATPDIWENELSP